MTRVLRKARYLAVVSLLIVGYPGSSGAEPAEDLLEKCRTRFVDNYWPVVQACTRLVEDYPNGSREQFLGYTFRGLAHSDVGMNAEAMADFDAALAIRDDLTITYLLRAEHLERIEAYDEAIDDYTTVLRLDPDNEGVLSLRAGLHERAGHTRLALGDYLACIDMNPSDSSYYHRIARLLLKDGYEQPDPGLALEYAKKAVALDRYAVHFEALAIAYAEVGNFDASVAAYKEAMAIGSERWTRGYIQLLKRLGYLDPAYDDGFTTKAEAALRRSLKDGHRHTFDARELKPG